MADHLVYNGSDRGEICEISYEDANRDDEKRGWLLVRYNVWVWQPLVPEDLDD